MTRKTIDRIVWWIPVRKWRDAFRKKFVQNHKIFTNTSSSVTRIQSYVELINAKTYLEIGVFKGKTFLNVNVPYKIAVDPNFKLDIKSFETENTVFYSETSDVFFENFTERAKKIEDKYDNSSFKFDVVYLDGLHTFEQTLRDFENSLAFAHDKTIWVFDDTVPCHFFSSLDSQSYARELRKLAGLSSDNRWHGDVYKVIFAIHDKYPEFSYCTQINKGNPQTILWRTKKPTERKKVFDTFTKSIADFCYEDFLKYAWVILPMNDEDVISKLYSNINPLDYKTGKEYAKVITPIRTDA